MTDFASFVKTAADVFAMVEGAIPAFASVVGGWYILQGFLRMHHLSADGRRGSVTASSVFSSFIFGALLLNFGLSESLSQSALGLDGGGAVGYGGDLGSPFLNAVMSGLLTIASGFGALGIFHGLLEFKKAGDGNSSGGSDSVWMGTWHVLGGAVCLNLSRFFT